MVHAAAAAHRAGRIEDRLLLGRQRVVERLEARLHGVDALDARLHDGLFHGQALDVARPLLHLGRQRVAARHVLHVGVVRGLGEGVPRGHLVGLEVEAELDVGTVAGAAGDLVEAERLGVHGAVLAMVRAAGAAEAALAGRRIGRRRRLGKLEQVVGAAVGRAGGHAGQGEAGGGHESGRQGKEGGAERHRAPRQALQDFVDEYEPARPGVPAGKCKAT